MTTKTRSTQPAKPKPRCPECCSAIREDNPRTGWGCLWCEGYGDWDVSPVADFQYRRNLGA